MFSHSSLEMCKMRFASRLTRMFGIIRSVRPRGLALRGGSVLLFAAGCFQPDEQADGVTYLPWNPATPVLDAGMQPVLGSDASSIVAPAFGQDATVAPPPMSGRVDAAAPGFAPIDANTPVGQDASPVGVAPEDAALAPDVGPIGPPPTALTFSVLTKSLGGRYAPRNVGAIWIENASGKWIKTLAVWAFVRERYLTRFRTASAGNRVDAMTSATLSQHTTHAVTWDLTDATGVTVPDGDYRVVVETTDRDATGDSTEVSFTKGPLPIRTMPSDVTHYVNMSLALE